MASEKRFLWRHEDRPASCPVGYRLSLSTLSVNSPCSLRSPTNYDEHHVPPKSARSERYHSRRVVRSPTPVVSFRNTPPVMLLPKVETKLAISWSQLTRESRSHVVPTDPRIYLRLSHEGQSLETINSSPDVNKQLILDALTYILASHEEGYKYIKTEHNKDSEYLDSYGQIEAPTTPKQVVNKALNEGYYIRLLKRIGVTVDLRCAECMRVVRKFGGCRGFFLWFLKQFDQLLRNIQPHFCNFVRKIEIRPRYDLRPSDVPRVRQAFGGSDGEDDLDGLESASSTGSLSEKRGAQARPSTPQKPKSGPRSAGAMTKKKKGSGKPKPKPPPAKPATGWAEKVFNLDQAEQSTTKPSPAPVPPANKKSVSSTSVDSNRRVVVKKAVKTKPAAEETTPRPTVEMVETPATPEATPERLRVEESPPVPAPDTTPSRAPPSPSLVDRRASRTPRSINQHRGTLPDAGMHNIKESGESDHDRMMKQTESGLNDAALKKLIQSSNHAVNHAGRLALSKQSSRFELPMDMLSLQTLTPQEYLRKYCVVSSRRQSLYHKMFIKNKEPKKTTLHVKELVKALKDVLTDTLDDNMVAKVLEMTDINEETEIDLKLFAGLGALSERMLYAKFVTEDTEGMADHQKERIECADFFALDWKFHGVNVNAPMERLLRSL